MVEGAGFEPAKHEAADLQSAGFDRSPTPPRLQKLGNSACAQLPCQLKLNYLLFFTYKRSKKIDLLSKKVIEKSLNSKEKETLEKLILLETVGSTNDEAKKLIETIEKNKAVAVFSEEQTIGRGTKGRSWVSPYGENIYFSLGWKSSLSINELMGLTIAIASSLAKDLNKLTEKNIKIKWPNDLYIDNKKFGGILVETTTTDLGTNLVIGIGINVQMKKESGSSIDQAWSSLHPYLTDEITRSDISSIILKNTVRLTIDYPSNGLAPYLDHYNQVNFLRDKICEVEINGNLITGKAGQVNNKGELLLKSEEKNIYLAGNEVNIKKTF